MTVQQLKYIVTVAETGSITEAAKQLFISQPSLSNAVKEIEKEIGIAIFLRSHAGITLTKEGMEFLGYARQVIQQMELLEYRYVAYKIGIIYDTPLSDMMIDRKVVNDNTDLCDWKFSDILYC